MDRTKGIGGTDIGAIVGVSPWKNKMDVYLEKVGITEPPDENEAMYWGKALEQPLAFRYIRDMPGDGWTLETPKNPDGMRLVHHDLPWYLGSPDGIMWPINDQYEKGGVDFKTTGSRNGYGEPGSDTVPDHIACQCHWYMGLTGAQWWDVATLFMGYRREFHIFHLERNQEIIDNLIAAGKDFWENHVLPQVPPELDASDASRTLLRHLYPESRGEVLPAPDDAMIWRNWLETANDTLKRWEEKKKLSQHHLEALVGDADSLLFDDGARFDWKRQKGRTVIDWYEVSTILGAELSDIMGEEHAHPFINDTIKLQTTTKPGIRVPRLWPAKEKK